MRRITKSRCIKVFEAMEREDSDFGQLRRLPSVLSLPKGVPHLLSHEGFINRMKHGDAAAKKLNPNYYVCKSGKKLRDNRTVWAPGVRYHILLRELDRWEEDYDNNY